MVACAGCGTRLFSFPSALWACMSVSEHAHNRLCHGDVVTFNHQPLLPNSCLSVSIIPQGPDSLPLLEDVGRLLLLDMLLGNADRLPFPDLGWRGNPHNVLLGAPGVNLPGAAKAIVKNSCYYLWPLANGYAAPVFLEGHSACMHTIAS